MHCLNQLGVQSCAQDPKLESPEGWPSVASGVLLTINSAKQSPACMLNVFMSCFQAPATSASDAGKAENKTQASISAGPSPDRAALESKLVHSTGPKGKGRADEPDEPQPYVPIKVSNCRRIKTWTAMGSLCRSAVRVFTYLAEYVDYKLACKMLAVHMCSNQVLGTSLRG